jgi:hypothetical protein
MTGCKILGLLKVKRRAFEMARVLRRDEKEPVAPTARA